MDFGKNDTIEYFFAIQKRKGQNTKMEENKTTKLTRILTINSGFWIWGLTFFVEIFLRGSTFVLCMNNSAKNFPQRKAAKR